MTLLPAFSPGDAFFLDSDGRELYARYLSIAASPDRAGRPLPSAYVTPDGRYALATVREGQASPLVRFDLTNGESMEFIRDAGSSAVRMMPTGEMGLYIVKLPDAAPVAIEQGRDVEFYRIGLAPGGRAVYWVRRSGRDSVRMAGPGGDSQALADDATLVASNLYH